MIGSLAKAAQLVISHTGPISFLLFLPLVSLREAGGSADEVLKHPLYTLARLVLLLFILHIEILCKS